MTSGAKGGCNPLWTHLLDTGGRNFPIHKYDFVVELLQP